MQPQHGAGTGQKKGKPCQEGKPFRSLVYPDKIRPEVASSEGKPFLKQPFFIELHSLCF